PRPGCTAAATSRGTTSRSACTCTVATWTSILPASSCARAKPGARCRSAPRSSASCAPDRPPADLQGIARTDVSPSSAAAPRPRRSVQAGGRPAGAALPVDWFPGGGGPRRGAAYGTAAPRDPLNVRAAATGLFTGKPQGFLDYARRLAPPLAGTDFLPRRL